MLVRHATLTRHLPSIAQRGLLCAKSKGKMKVVWLHKADPKNSFWAFAHTIKRHHAKAEAIVILTVDVPKSWLRKSSRPGLTYSVRDVPAERIRGILTFSEIAQ